MFPMNRHYARYASPNILIVPTVSFCKSEPAKKLPQTQVPASENGDDVQKLQPQQIPNILQNESKPLEGECCDYWNPVIMQYGQPGREQYCENHFTSHEGSRLVFGTGASTFCYDAPITYAPSYVPYREYTSQDTIIEPSTNSNPSITITEPPKIQENYEGNPLAFGNAATPYGYDTSSTHMSNSVLYRESTTKHNIIVAPENLNPLINITEPAGNELFRESHKGNPLAIGAAASTNNNDVLITDTSNSVAYKEYTTQDTTITASTDRNPSNNIIEPVKANLSYSPLKTIHKENVFYDFSETAIKLSNLDQTNSTKSKRKLPKLNDAHNVSSKPKKRKENCTQSSELLIPKKKINSTCTKINTLTKQLKMVEKEISKRQKELYLKNNIINNEIKALTNTKPCTLNKNTKSEENSNRILKTIKYSQNKIENNKNPSQKTRLNKKRKDIEKITNDADKLDEIKTCKKDTSKKTKKVKHKEKYYIVQNTNRFAPAHIAETIEQIQKRPSTCGSKNLKCKIRYRKHNLFSKQKNLLIEFPTEYVEISQGMPKRRVSVVKNNHTENKSNRCNNVVRTIELTINIVSNSPKPSTSTNDLDGQDDLLRNDLSFLDDINVDDIIESLNDFNSTKKSTDNSHEGSEHYFNEMLNTSNVNPMPVFSTNDRNTVHKQDGNQNIELTPVLQNIYTETQTDSSVNTENPSESDIELALEKLFSDDTNPKNPDNNVDHKNISKDFTEKYNSSFHEEYNKNIHELNDETSKKPDLDDIELCVKEYYNKKDIKNNSKSNKVEIVDQILEVPTKCNIDTSQTKTVTKTTNNSSVVKGTKSQEINKNPLNSNKKKFIATKEKQYKKCLNTFQTGAETNKEFKIPNNTTCKTLMTEIYKNEQIDRNTQISSNKIDSTIVKKEIDEEKNSDDFTKTPIQNIANHIDMLGKNMNINEVCSDLPLKTVVAKLQYDKTTIASNSMEKLVPRTNPIDTQCYLLKKITHRLQIHLRVKYKATGLIHSGAFSQIIQYKDIANNILVAKVIKNRNLMEYKKEQILLKLQDGIPKEKLGFVFLYKGLPIDDYWCYLMDYYPKNLETILKETCKPFHIDMIQNLARQLILAIVVLRNNNIIHSDIKPSHILVNSAHDQVKLCGFDESYSSCNAIVKPNIGTIHYRAPEVILGYAAGHTIDVWSAGIVLHEMASYQKLFPGTTNNEVLYQQMCTIGGMPLEVVQKSQFKNAHYQGRNFIRKSCDLKKDGGAKNTTECVSSFYKSNRMATSIFAAYFRDLAKERSKNEKESDLEKLRQFTKILGDMLVMDPRDRMAIEFVYANFFIQIGV